MYGTGGLPAGSPVGGRSPERRVAGAPARRGSGAEPGGTAVPCLQPAAVPADPVVPAGAAGPGAAGPFPLWWLRRMRPALLQELLDAAREKRGVDHDFRLLRRDGGAVWVNLRAEILSTRQGATVFRGVFLDIDRLRREGQDLQAAPFPGGRRLCGMRRRCWTGCR